MFERFTDRARQVLQLAQEEARLCGHPFIGTEHVLLGLLQEGEGVAAKVLESLGVSLAGARDRVKEIVPASPAVPGSRPFTPRAKKVLELSLREALQLGHSYIGTEHLLLGLVREGEGVATRVLVGLGIEPARVRLQVIQWMAGNPSSQPKGRRRGAGYGPLGRVGASRPPSPESRPAVVGRRWSAEVVAPGRRPEDFAAAYDELAALAGRLGLHDLDAARVHVGSVETEAGPGLRLSLVEELQEEPTASDDLPDAPGSD